MIVSISINTQNLIKEMREQEEKENEIKAYCDYIQSIITENTELQEHQNKKYQKANENYLKYYVPESEIDKLPEERRKALKTLDKLQRKYYFKAIDYGNKNNILNNVLKAYLESMK